MIGSNRWQFVPTFLFQSVTAELLKNGHSVTTVKFRDTNLPPLPTSGHPNFTLVSEIVIVTTVMAVKPGARAGAPEHQQQPRRAPLHDGRRGGPVQAAPRAYLGIRPESAVDH